MYFFNLISCNDLVSIRGDIGIPGHALVKELLQLSLGVINNQMLIQGKSLIDHVVANIESFIRHKK
jgi:hypothetical protein